MNPSPHWRVRLVATCLVIATALAYSNTYHVPFLFDDLWSIPLNESIRSFATALSPPNTNGETVSGRPLLNFTFAINQAISGNDVWSYHALNLLIHACAGLALLGLARRTLLLPSMRERFGRAAPGLSATIAALWMLHPVQTVSVTYISQRAESLMGLWYLLALYCFARSVECETRTVSNAECGARNAELQTQAATRAPPESDPSAIRNPRSAFNLFRVLSVLCCLLGMASKEVMASAPLIVLLYDRAFVSGTFRGAWTRRRAYYLLLASTWALTAWLAINAGSRGATAGFGAGVSSWTYLLTQCQAIPHYLRLAFWPGGLIFDYGTPLAASLSEVWLRGLLVLALLGAAVLACARRPRPGFPAIFFFAVLAPTSSFIPVATQTIATHRMYLPLAAVVALAVIAVHGLWRFWRGGAPRQSKNQKPKSKVAIAFAAACAATLATTLAALTFHRNTAYKTSISIWTDTLAKLPEKDRARAHNNLASALLDIGENEKAIGHCAEAVRLKPDFHEAYNNHGYALAQMGRYAEALWYYDKSLSYLKGSVELTLNNRGHALYQLGRHAEALKDYRAAVELRPGYVKARGNYASVLCDLGRYDEALAQLDTALAMDPGFAAAWNNRGNVYAARGDDPAEALRCYMRAVELDPALVLAIDNVARYNLFLGRPAEALPYFERAIALEPGNALFRHNYAEALARLGRLDDAIAQEREVLRLAPGFPRAQERLNAYKNQKNAPGFPAALSPR